MRLDYFLYMAEAEGQTQWVDTPEAKLNASIKDFVRYYREGYDINDEDNQDYILRQNGLSLDMLTDKQCRYLMQQVEKRLR